MEKMGKNISDIEDVTLFFEDLKRPEAIVEAQYNYNNKDDIERKEQNEAEDSKMTEFLFLIVNSSLLFPLSLHSYTH